MSRADNERRDVFDERAIHLGAGFKEQERPHVLETLAALGAHLKRWNPDEVDVEVSVQDRGGKEQRVTLRTTLPGLPPLVAVEEVDPRFAPGAGSWRGAKRPRVPLRRRHHQG